jgi:hypothetical protein
MSLEVFLACEREQPERDEYSRGVITMTDLAAHVRIALNFAIALR